MNFPNDDIIVVVVRVDYYLLCQLESVEETHCYTNWLPSLMNENVSSWLNKIYSDQ